MNLLTLLAVALGLNFLYTRFIKQREPKGLRLFGLPHWWIAPVTDPAAWLRSLPLLEPDGAVLYLEGVHDHELRSYLESRAYPTPTRIGPMTIFPRQPFFHMAATPENLDGLARLMETGQFERLAYHAGLYRDQRLLLDWYECFCPDDERGIMVTKQGVEDVIEDPMIVAAEVPEERVRAFAMALRAAFRLEKKKDRE